MGYIKIDDGILISRRYNLSSKTIMAQKRLNIGVVGIGRVGQSHALNVLHKAPRANLLCACSPADADIAWADEHLVPHGVQVFRTFEELIDTPGLEAVIIASLTSLHTQHTTAALERGIHVLCEKPVCTSVEEASLRRVI